ncbi:hypothetical protein N9B88_01125 [Rubripirellula sp.]|nr:hypothetical protein [Rubripirellula sp.]
MKSKKHSGAEKRFHDFGSSWRCEFTNNTVGELQELPSNKHNLSENPKIISNKQKKRHCVKPFTNKIFPEIQKGTGKNCPPAKICRLNTLLGHDLKGPDMLMPAY